MISVRVLFALGLCGAVSACVSPSIEPGIYGDTVGQIAAAHELSSCDGVARLEGDFVQEAAELAANQQGLSKQKLLAPLYYEKKVRLTAAANAALQARDVDVGSTSSKCEFARRVAGTNDPIGRFLKK